MTIAKLAALAILLAAGPARAQSAEADVLFREGKKLLKAGKIREACEKLDASERTESSVGTLLNLADCREKNHQLATAWATFRRAVVAAKTTRDGKREKEARRREKLLVPRLSYLTVNVPEASRVDGLTIARNGIEVDRALWDQSVPIDAGEYELAAAADGYVRWTESVRIEREAQKVEIDVPKLAAKPAPKDKPDLAATDAPKVRASATPARKRATDDAEHDDEGDAAIHEQQRPSRFTRTRGIAIAVGAIGAGGIAVGIGYALRGKHLQQQSDALCPTTTCGDDTGLSLNASARRDATIANIGFAAGGGLLATALVLWIVGGPHVAPIVAHDRVGLAFEGHF